MAVVVLLAALPSVVVAQTPPFDPSTLTIEQLLDVKLVSTASKFSQETTHAPASVTVITAEQIRQFGYRTLADVLGGVRGFYTTYDRNYSYVGVRGFARPGDYNTRVLVLVDGHRLNEPVYDMSPIGTDFPIDVSLIDRVEVIRGPGSSLYGTSAFLAVINVLTKRAESSPGTRADVSVGTLFTTRATASIGHVFDSGNEVLLAASGYRSRGNERLYFPEFDQPGVSDGVFLDGDHDRSASVSMSAAVGRLRISGAYVDRAKQVPTASFGTVFADRRAQTTDRQGYVDATFTGRVFGGWTGVARAGLDVYDYAGTYPFATPNDGTVVQFDGARSVETSAELTVNRPGRRHLVTLGAEVRQTLTNRQFASDIYGVVLDERHPATILSVYAQDQLTIRPWLLVNGGIRVDLETAFDASVTPRAGLVVLPGKQSAFKMLHGRAFRAPNSYELYYYATMQDQGLTLEPETIATSEAVWEQSIGSRARASVSAFHYDVKGLVEQQALGSYDPETGYGLYFANAGRTTANGAEAELEGMLGHGLTTSVSYSHVRAKDWATQGLLSNSPRHLANLRVAAPIGPLALRMAAEIRGVGARRAIDGGAVPGYVVANVIASKTLGKRLDVEFGLYNALDARYADPGAEEHAQRAIVQDGRTARIRLVTRF